MSGMGEITCPNGSICEIGGLSTQVARKAIKNIHLRVYPPAGQVRISAPRWMSLDAIRVFALAKIGWIKKIQDQLREQESQRESSDRDGHYVWGRRCLLRVEEQVSAPAVSWEHDSLLLRVRPGSSQAKQQAVLDEWYREQLKVAVPPLVAKWEPRMGVKVSRFFVRRMKTRWGTCSPRLKTIRLNSELAKKPPECLEYVVVHEMAHFLEHGHNARFRALLDQFQPQWRMCRAHLNRK